jgi:enolase
MKQINMLEYLEVIGEGDYKVYINNHIKLIDAIYETANNAPYWSGEDDCEYIDLAIEVYGAEFIEEGALQAAWAGRDIERHREYFEQIEEWAENLDFEELDEDIKEEIIQDIAENDMELKIIESVRQNDYDKFLQIIIDFTYTEIDE